MKGCTPTLQQSLGFNCLCLPYLYFVFTGPMGVKRDSKIDNPITFQISLVPTQNKFGTNGLTLTILILTIKHQTQ